MATEPTLVCPKCNGKGGWETGPHSESCHLCDGTGRIKPTPDRCICDLTNPVPKESCPRHGNKPTPDVWHTTEPLFIQDAGVRHEVAFYDHDSRLLFTIGPDRVLRLGEDVTCEEAAAKFVELVKEKLMPLPTTPDGGTAAGRFDSKIIVSSAPATPQGSST